MSNSELPAIADYVESLENPQDARLIRDMIAENERLRAENADLITDNNAGCMANTQLNRENERLKQQLAEAQEDMARIAAWILPELKKHPDYGPECHICIAISELEKWKEQSPSSARDKCISAGCNKESIAGSVLCQEHYDHLPPKLRGK